MNIQFRDLIDNSPRSPGIYKMYDIDGLLLYIGKAKDLSARLKQYIDIPKLEPHKQIMRSLVTRVEWELTRTESEALILEEKLIKKDKPKYNIIMTDGKMYPILVLTNHEFPRLMKFRGKLSQKRDVFGPYPSVSSLDETIKKLQKVCQLRTCTDSFMRNRARPCLLYQIGRCSAPCKIKQDNYSENVALARRLLTGNIAPIVQELSEKMNEHSNNLDFESAAKIRDKISALSQTSSRGIKSGKKSAGINWQESVKELRNWLGIEINHVCVFDNSHIFGTSPVGAMIVFGKDGFIKKEYRHFKLKDQARAGNDIAMMEEFIDRVVKRKNQIDLIIVDGGQAQWNIAKKTAPDIPILGITKGAVRDGDEHFILPDNTTVHDVPKDSQIFLTLRAVRDEAHRFAISFHRARRAKSATASRLDEIEGIGPARKRALLHHFGSVKQIADADISALVKVPGLGKSAAIKIYSYFHS